MRGHGRSRRVDRSPEPSILHLTAIPATAEAFLLPHFRWQREAGWSVSLLSGNLGATRPALWAETGVSLHEMPIARQIAITNDLRSIWAALRVMQTTKPDVVVGHTPKAALVAMIAGRMARVGRCVFHMHGLRSEGNSRRSGRLVRLMERVTCLLAHEVVCVSESLARVAEASDVIRPNRAVVVGNGSISGIGAEFLSADLRPGRSTRQRLADLKLEPSAHVIGFVGRLAADKGVADIYEAFRLMREDHPNACLLIVGEVDDTDPVSSELLESLRTDPSVRLTGWRSDIAELLSVMTVLVSASRREGFPVGLLEAAAMRVPVVA